MGANDYYKHHDHNAICDVCGCKFKASEMLLRWDGARVCKEDWEPRTPQDFMRGIKEDMKLDFSRPEATDVFREVGDIASLSLDTHPLNSTALG